MKNLKVEFDCIKGAKIFYFITTSGANVSTNTYHVYAYLRDLHGGSPEARYDGVLETITNNEDTLTDEAICDLLNDVLLDGGDIEDY